MSTSEVVFQVREAPEGGYTARAVGHNIFTQGEDWEDLKFMLRDAVLCHFDEGEAPAAIRVHMVQNEAIPVSECLETYPAWNLSSCYVGTMAITSSVRGAAT